MQLEETKILEEDIRRKEEELIKNITPRSIFGLLIDCFRGKIDFFMLELSKVSLFELNNGIL